MSVVITGIDGLRNRGVEALVVSSIEQLQQRQPNLTVNILTRTPDYDENRLQGYKGVNLVDDNLHSSPQLSSRQSRLRRVLAKFFPRYKPPTPEPPASVRMIREASVVIASGGDIFSSDYGGCYRHLQPLKVALSAGVPVVFLAQSIGPFKTDKEAEAWLSVARESKLITVREKLSYHYLTKNLGLSTDLVKHTADPAFLLTPPQKGDVAKLIHSYGITKDRPVVALAASQGINRYSGCDYHEHLKVLSQVVNMLLDEFDAQVLLIPHVHDIRPSNDDRVLATKLLRLLDFDPRVRLAGAEHSASEFKGLIAECDMVIAERMHATIAGLSSGVCPVAVGYSVKAEGIMADLLGTESLHKELLISTHDFLDAEAAFTTIRNAWNRRHEVASQLNEVLPQVKKDTATNFDMISQLLG